jgi:hypothetical protein
MGNWGRESHYLSKNKGRKEGRKTDWTEFAGLCVADEIMADLIMDPHYHNFALSLSDMVTAL